MADKQNIKDDLNAEHAKFADTDSVQVKPKAARKPVIASTVDQEVIDAVKDVRWDIRAESLGEAGGILIREALVARGKLSA